MLVACCAVLPSCNKGERKKTVVGFSQIGSESDWRSANTRSIKAEAEKRGVELRFADAQQKQQNQITALKSFIAQDVDVIAFSPVRDTGWTPVLKEIKKAGIPVILTDRGVDADPSLYTTFIGSDFGEEGRRAARWLVENTTGELRIAELQGSPGASCAKDRLTGFAEVIKDHPRMKVILSQDGDFQRAKGKEVMEQWLAGPKGKDINCLFAHNDDMAMGAIQAMKAAGIKPGKDVIIVSIDAVKAAFDALVAGELNCTVECNPLLGPALFDAVEAIMSKKELSRRIMIKESIFDQKNVKDFIDSRKY